MANMCSVEFKLTFNTIKAKEKFILDFSKIMSRADLRNEGVEIVKNSKCLFDPMLLYIEDDKYATLAGWVRWSLEHESIREFTEQYLTKMNIESFECYYEETGNMIYGKYHYENGELIDYFVSDSHPVWTNTEYEDDNYFDSLDTALKNEGVVKFVA